MDARQVLRTVWERAVRAVGGRELTAAALADVARAGRAVRVIGAGKASVAMSAGAAAALGVVEGVVVTKDEDARGAPPGVSVLAAGHPLPDERSEAAARALAAAGAGSGTVVAIWSGGASALAVWPSEGITLADKIAVTRALAAAGASIGELNCVRKHLSEIKGGRLGRLLAARGEPVTAVMLSDVLGDDPSTIGGGPFVGDPTTCRDALDVIRARGVSPPAAVEAWLVSGRGETPKPGDPLLARVDVRVVGGNDRLVDAAAAALRDDGVDVVTTEKRFAGSVEELAARLVAAAGALTGGGARAVVIGGEPTIRLPATAGRGGRAQHAALLAAAELARRGPAGPAGVAPDAGAGVTILCAASDGSDGATGDAGAIVDAETWGRTGVDAAAALARHDSGTALAAAGALLPGGATGTNACDLYVVLATP